MSSGTYWESGSWKVICDVCGREFRSYQLTKRWDGLMTCSEDWEPRHPQDFVRGVADKIAPPYTRPEQEDEFIFSCTLATSQGASDYGVADCARAGMNQPEYYLAPYICTYTSSLGEADVGVADCARAYLEP